MLKCLLIKYVKMTEYPAFCLPDNSLYAFYLGRLSQSIRRSGKGSRVHVVIIIKIILN